MQQMNVMLSQVAALMILVFIGFLAGKKGYLPIETGGFLSKTVIRITAPSLLISTMTSYNFDAKTLSDGIWVGFFAVIFMFLSLLASFPASRLLKLEGTSANVFRAHTMLGNVGYMALPLLKAVLGDKAVVLAAFFVLSFESLNWTVGVILMNRHRKLSLAKTFKNFINANTIACIAGILFAMTNLQHYIRGTGTGEVVFGIFHNVFNLLGNCTLPLVMLFIGMSAAERSGGGFRELLKKPATLTLCVLRLAVIPLIDLGILLLLGNLVDPFVRTIVILEMAMPCSAIIVVMSAEYGSDHRQASDNVLYSTILSLFTLPLFVLLLNFISNC